MNTFKTLNGVVPMSDYDEKTGEVAENDATDHARSFTNFFAGLEDGQLNAELSSALRDLSKKMYYHSVNYGSKAKGKIKIDLDLTLEKGCFDINCKFKIAEPEAPRLRSIMWSDKNHNLVPSNPRQVDMFKDVNAKDIKVI